MFRSVGTSGRSGTSIEKYKELCNENGFILLSVPKEPIWRICNMARGKYWKDLGNTPGHIQHWTKKKFCRMVVNNDNDMKNCLGENSISVDNGACKEGISE